MTEFSEIPEIQRRLEELSTAPDVRPEIVMENLQAAYEGADPAGPDSVGQGEGDTLAAEHEDLVRQHERIISLVPTPVLTTDHRARIQASNGAAAALLRTPISHLTGKPVFSFITPESRRELHRLLDSRDAESEPCRCHLELLPGDGINPASGRAESVSVAAIVLPVPRATDEMTWILLPPGDAERQSNDADLAGALTQMAALPPMTQDLRDYLQGAAAVVVSHLGAGAVVSIAVGTVDAPQALASTGAQAQRLDGAQMAAGEGPTVAAYGSPAVIESPALCLDTRWPRFAAQLSASDGGAVAVPMNGDDAPLGVITAYLPTEPWDRGVARRLPLLAAAVAAGVLEMTAKAELVELAAHLRTAMDSRSVIEQAKGIIMASVRCDADTAFAHLVGLSSAQNRKLRDVAADIVDDVRQ